jgi:RNA polymerase sigma factor (sigma-70 family)
MQATQVKSVAPQRLAPPAAATAASDDVAVVQDHADGVWRFLRCLGASRDVADDLTQEAFAVAWRKRKQHLPPAALSAFLRRAARFSWLEHCRAERRAEAALSALALQAWEEETLDDGAELADAARACVQQLRGRAAQAVQLAYGHGEGRQAIASALGMLPNGVKTLLARTRAWLEQCIRRRLS